MNVPFWRGVRVSFVALLILFSVNAVGQTPAVLQTLETVEDHGYRFNTVLLESTDPFHSSVPAMQIRDAASNMLLYQFTADDLPFKEGDCELTCSDLRQLGSDDAKVCFGQCVIGEMHFLAFDPVNEAAFIYVRTDTGTNVNQIIFVAYIDPNELTRVDDFSGSSVIQGVASPNGTYLAYSFTSRESTARSYIRVTNLETDASTRFPSGAQKSSLDADSSISLDEIKWMDDHTIQYTEIISKTLNPYTGEEIIISKQRVAYDLSTKQAVSAYRTPPPPAKAKRPVSKGPARSKRKGPISKVPSRGCG